MSLCHRDWCVSGCGFEGLGLQNCLAGDFPRTKRSFRRVDAELLEEVSYETLVLET